VSGVLNRPAEGVPGPVRPVSTGDGRRPTAKIPAHKSRIGHETRITLISLLAGLPAVLLSIVLLCLGPYSAKLVWTLALVVGGIWLAVSLALKNRVALPLQTISNVLASLREGDFSLQARGTGRPDALGGVLVEVNALSSTLKEQRLGAVEAATLLRNVMQEIDVAIFAFDAGQILRLVNRAGENLLAASSRNLIGSRAADLGLAPCLQGEDSRLMEASFPGGAGRWEMRRTKFWQSGSPHQLLVLSDLSKALREEERQAWKRLIRVLGHELNNSITPIKSIAASLITLLSRDPRPTDWEEDARRGLGVIENRSESLRRFMEGYARLAHLPQPRLQPVDIGQWIHRTACLETRMTVSVDAGPDIVIQADGDQLDQLLINLVRNGVDAALLTGGGVRIGWARVRSNLEVWVEDAGPGISNTSNLFVPLFTTKPHGSGIGLALSRQIAEAHRGSLKLENRTDAKGCRALLQLPI
jgi:two-component system, NtrC family, nitrogen regulation sensor histidine kinase NtrY